MDTTVVVTRCETYESPAIAEAIARQFDLLGGVQKYVKRGDSVLLKPNFIAPRSRRHATQTHPVVILEVARLLKDFGARPFVGDSPAWGNVFGCVKKLQLDKDLAKLAVPVRQLNQPRWSNVSERNRKVGISSAALEADVIINLPKFKTHQQLVATFAVKNMFGCVAGKRKALWHFTRGKTEEFCELLIEIYKYLSPALTIIDAVQAMDGQGPIRGRTRPLGWLIAGQDPIACEIVCSELVDIDPANLPIVNQAKVMSFGCHDRKKIQTIGDDYSQSIATDFKLPILVPVRFSLLHVCKSICKQIILLAKGQKKA
ncbi:MAG: DUF362 domain-containing protein [Sedimentisphaerales bacterium]|nr:DUF362 domain-containing protein [Sedimentisphaerales bacterium]